MIPISKRFAILVLAGIPLAGCAGSPPVHYHALVKPALPPATGGNARMLVELLPIALPERLNREEMVLTGDNGRIEVRDGDRWAAPLSDEIRQIVADALWLRVGAADIYRAPIPQTASGLPQYRLSLRIERFEAVPGRSAQVEGSWTARKLPQGEAAVCRASFSQDLPARVPEAAALALSAAVVRLAETVAVSLERLNQGQGNKCP